MRGSWTCCPTTATLLSEQDRGQLPAVEKRNLRIYGYGAKGFTLSMIETALELTDGAVSTRVIREILAVGREMLIEPIEPLPGVDNALASCRSAIAWC
jgi:putative hydrolase of the HAD superfamily